MPQAISAPTLIINNDTIPIVPNSLKYDAGEGEINVRAASTGGGGVESIHTINAESKISKVMVDVYLTADMDKNILGWKNRIGTNSITFTQTIGATDFISRSFDEISLTNAVERDAGADGVTSLEFAGGQMSAS